MSKWEYDAEDSTVIDDAGNLLADVDVAAACRNPKLGDLLAAAPDLLEALEELDILRQAMAEFLTPLADDDQWAASLITRCDAASSTSRAAIAKAKGEAPDPKG